MNLNDTGLHSIRSLSWTAPPLPTESAAGYFARILDGNGYPTVAEGFRLGGVKYMSTGTAASQAIRDVDRLAKLFNRPVDQLAALLNCDVDVEGATQRAQFGDVQVRGLYIDQEFRRVAPGSLKASLHHRSLWTLRPFPVCVETFETLIANCPECHAPLRWFRTRGINICETCEFDLRSAQGEAVECDYEAVRFAASLVQPTCQAEMVPLHGDLSGLSRSELFEFLQGLICTQLPMIPGQVTPFRRLARVEDFRESTVERIGKAARALMNWPAGMHDLADEIRAGSDSRPGFYGVKKELGPMVLLEAADQHLSDATRTVLRDFIDKDMTRSEHADRVRRSQNRASELISLAQACVEFSYDARTLQNIAAHGGITITRVDGVANSPQLVSRGELEAFAARRNSVLSQATIIGRTGFRHEDVLGLFKQGVFKPVGADIQAAVGMGTYIYKADLNSMMDGMLEKVLPGLPTSGMRLALAASRLHDQQNVWPAILEAIACDRLQIFRNTERQASFIGSFVVRSLKEVADAIGRADSAAMDGMSNEEAAKEIGTSHTVACALRAKGYIGTPNSVMGASRKMVAKFKEDFILTNEILTRTRFSSITIKPALANAKINPAFVVGKNSRGTDSHAWNRAEVEPFIARNPPWHLRKWN